ncbi:peptidase C15 [Pannus brasiliensis CCIBt3594]|uniref:Peptidase C15 n=1 Tax=Pannus brasiliensis CCIBt3594 TaxID=1427578 RepID=A0AAW9QZ45_9CHRO
MNSRVLLTSFDTWLPHHSSNASDDLLAYWQGRSSESLFYLRRLPVDIARSSERVLKAIDRLTIDFVLCCGMAEDRYRLSLESNARGDLDRLHPPIALENLIAKLEYTSISHDAGRFVCEGLYYQTLKHHRRALFLHVPLLRDNNFPAIDRDFSRIVEVIKNADGENRTRKA